jgi:hypothetical protein
MGTFGDRGSSNHAAARRRSDAFVAEFAAAMTEPERTVTTTHAPPAKPDTDDVRVLAERMFRI